MKLMWCFSKTAQHLMDTQNVSSQTCRENIKQNIQKTVPATNVSVESSFIALSIILTKLRLKLSKKSLSNTQTAKLNYWLLNFLNFDITDNTIG